MIRHREDAGITDTNEFLFALPSQTGKVKTVNIWTIMRSFAVACGATNPSSLTGTNLRKHIASFCATKENLKDNDIANIADFLGHHVDVHRKIYRNNPLGFQVSQLPIIFEAAQGNGKNATIRAKTRGKPPPECVPKNLNPENRFNFP